MADITNFNLNIIRKDRLARFNDDFKEADIFQQLCFDLLGIDLKDRIAFTPYKTAGPDGAIDMSGIDKGGDTVADEISMLRLEKYAGSLKPEIRKVFDFAIENNSFVKCVRAFERIVDWDVLKNKEYIFCEIFSDLIKEEAPAHSEGAKLITTSLVQEEQIVKLLVDNPDFFEDQVKKIDFALTLSLKMKYFSKQEQGNLFWFKSKRNYWNSQEFVSRKPAHNSTG